MSPSVFFFSWALMFLSVKAAHWLFTDTGLLTNLIPFVAVALSGPLAVKKLLPRFRENLKSGSLHGAGVIGIKMLLLGQLVVLSVLACYLLTWLVLITMYEEHFMAASATNLLAAFGFGVLGLALSNLLCAPMAWLASRRAYMVLRNAARECE